MKRLQAFQFKWIPHGQQKQLLSRFVGAYRFVFNQMKREVENPIPTDGMIEIDIDIAWFATLSNGQIIEPIHRFKKSQEALGKAKKRLHKLYHRIANRRKNFLYQTSSLLSKNHAIVCIEDLTIKNLSQSATGHVEQHGKKVRVKTGLNCSILDQGWYECRFSQSERYADARNNRLKRFY